MFTINELYIKTKCSKNDISRDSELFKFLLKSYDGLYSEENPLNVPILIIELRSVYTTFDVYKILTFDKILQLTIDSDEYYCWKRL